MRSRGALAPVGAAVAAAAVVVRRRREARRREGLARACHELRGPLGAARLGVELAARGGELAPERLRAIAAELDRAALVLDDLEALRRRRRAREGPPKSRAGRWLSPVAPADAEACTELDRLLRDSVEAWRATAEAAGKEVRLELPAATVVVRGERLRLAQAVGNLIANAIEHGGPHIVVRAGRDGAQARVEVIDDGPGLPAAVDRIAARPRAGNGARGRGLAIARELAAAQGGRLAAAPTRRGARLVLELDAALSHRTAPYSAGAAGVRGGAA